MTKKIKKTEFIIFTNNQNSPQFFAISKRGLIGMLKVIIDNNLYDISQDPITIWDRKVFEKQSGIKVKDLPF